MHTLPVAEVRYLTQSSGTLGHTSFQTDLSYDVQILSCRDLKISAKKSKMSDRGNIPQNLVK